MYRKSCQSHLLTKVSERLSNCGNVLEKYVTMKVIVITPSEKKECFARLWEKHIAVHLYSWWWETQTVLFAKFVFSNPYTHICNIVCLHVYAFCEFYTVIIFVSVCLTLAAAGKKSKQLRKGISFLDKSTRLYKNTVQKCCKQPYM